ncbi:hypothetical protein CLF_102373 [Clonorchis sinensis]|uniref:Uncharacterized protein n=1 Tax=Clonorchis sinensis TaxID=79923 RepID=G7Y7S2_CLOSI|nr:hypothetical protein CLF_102373 [Clonorchis sinensis]
MEYRTSVHSISHFAYMIPGRQIRHRYVLSGHATNVLVVARLILVHDVNNYRCFLLCKAFLCRAASGNHSGVNQFAQPHYRCTQSDWFGSDTGKLLKVNSFGSTGLTKPVNQEIEVSLVNRRLITFVGQSHIQRVMWAYIPLLFTPDVNGERAKEVCTKRRYQDMTVPWFCGDAVGNTTQLIRSMILIAYIEVKLAFCPSGSELIVEVPNAEILITRSFDSPVYQKEVCRNVYTTNLKCPRSWRQQIPSILQLSKFRNFKLDTRTVGRFSVFTVRMGAAIHKPLHQADYYELQTFRISKRSIRRGDLYDGARSVGH